MWTRILNIWKSHNLVDEAWDKLYEILEMNQEMFLEAIKMLRESDDKIDIEKMHEQNRAVRRYVEEIKRKTMIHCTVSGATAMPTAMVIASMVIDVLSINEYIKNVLDVAEHHPTLLNGGKFENDLKRIEEAATNHFNSIRSCIESNDENKARNLLEEYQQVSEVCDANLTGLVLEKDKSIRSGSIAALTLYIHSLKQIHFHLSNMTKNVVEPLGRV